MSTTTMLHVRVDEATKKEATAALAAMGLTVSEAVRVFLARVAREQAMPFAVKVPNARTRAAMREADEIVRSGNTRFQTAEELFADLDGER